MVAFGVTTVIDLRTKAELAGAPADPRFPRLGAAVAASRAAGVTYLHHPLVDEVKGKVATGVGRYIEIVDTRQAAFGEVFNAIAEAPGPVLFHCFAGKDRTGLVAAMLLELAGVEREHIAADYCETDIQLAKQYEIWLREAAPDRLDEIRADLCCPADRILGVLDHVDRSWGGVAAYLEAGGVSASHLDRLSSRLA
jgi:protein-tyrosine phosphatase